MWSGTINRGEVRYCRYLGLNHETTHQLHDESDELGTCAMFDLSSCRNGSFFSGLQLL